MTGIRSRGRKIVTARPELGRTAHFDAFRVGSRQPRTTVVMLGGSGMTRAEYERRAESVVPVFDEDLARLEGEDLQMAFLFVSAPWDMAFRDVVNDVATNVRWRRHFERDVMPLVETATVYGCAYSGGAALLLSGVHEFVSGATTIGGDLIPESFSKPEAWPSPLSAIYNLADPVFAANRGRISQLVESGDARLLRKLPGTHGFTDYVRNGSWAGVMRRAWQEWKQQSR